MTVRVTTAIRPPALSVGTVVTGSIQNRTIRATQTASQQIVASAARAATITHTTVPIIHRPVAIAQPRAVASTTAQSVRMQPPVIRLSPPVAVVRSPYLAEVPRSMVSEADTATRVLSSLSFVSASLAPSAPIIVSIPAVSTLLSTPLGTMSISSASIVIPVAPPVTVRPTMTTMVSPVSFFSPTIPVVGLASNVRELTPILQPTSMVASVARPASPQIITVITSSLIPIAAGGAAPIIGPTELHTGSMLYSGSFAIGSDVYNLDTPSDDLRSFNGELISSFDQLGSSTALPECELIALIKTNNKVVVAFRLGSYDQFSIRIWDMFFDKKVFYNGFTTIDLRGDYLTTDFLTGAPLMSAPSDVLSFTRNQAKSGAQRNKDILKRNGINIDLNYVITGDDIDNKNKAKKLLEIGVFDYNFNSHIQQNTIFVHKIYGILLAAAAGMVVASVAIAARPGG